MHYKPYLFFLLAFISSLTFGQKDGLRSGHLNRLTQFLSIPNNASKETHVAENLEWLNKEFQLLGFTTEVIENEQPFLLASKSIAADLPTVLFYMHFDGQPVDGTKWAQADPYTPVFKLKKDERSFTTLTNAYALRNHRTEDIRVYARSASDDKGPIAMFLSALTELQQRQDDGAFNMKVILDSEEEKGSPHLEKLVNKYTDELRSDYFVVFDGPMHDSGNPTLLYGVRGVSGITMEIYGVNKPQHSGHYGNYAPNPVFRTSELLASMKDENGRVLIPKYYDGITISKKTRSILEAVPDNEKVIRERAGFKNAEQVAVTYQEAMQYPSLNVRGIRSAWVGNQVRTVVPDKVIVEMDIRTVPESHPDTLVNRVKAHIKNQGFTILDRPATKEDLLKIDKPLYFKYNHYMFPFRTDMDSKIGDWLRKSVGKKSLETVQIRISGGSVPLSFFINALHVPTVLVPLVNPDNNQHSPNENLKLQNYFQGIETIKTILTTPID